MVDYTSADFNIKELGSFYREDSTYFSCFSPDSEKMFLVLANNKYEMHKQHYTFYIGLKGNLEYYRYHFENEEGESFCDPFAYLSDEKDSIILDPRKFLHEKYYPSELKDVVIYETSVRDFSSDESYIGKYHKKFLALSETNVKLHDYYVLGLDYIKNLGYTHIQLMPVLEYDNLGSEYNWGYNPVNYNYCEKDYVVEQNNPYAYINELRQTINELHKNDIRVTLDCVFNHVGTLEKYDLNKMIKGHVFRRKENGEYANGSYCGNEIKSEDPFMRAYIIEMVERYLYLYDIDGVRLDLMGLLDIDTINELAFTLKNIKKDFLVYGEGWNMGEVLKDEQKANLLNADKQKDIGFFSDDFRETMISFVCGNDSIDQDVFRVLNGNGNNLEPYQAINYVECHDGYTFFDRLINYLPNDSLEVDIRRCKLALALCILAKGVPFIHCGQEFLRTKQLVNNSYNSGDEVNKIDWHRRVEFNSVCDYVKDLISIRKEYTYFLKENSNTEFYRQDLILVYKINDLTILINNTYSDYVFNDGQNYQVILDMNGKNDYLSQNVTVFAHSLVIAKNVI